MQQLQKTATNQTTATTNNNFTKSWETIPVKADSTPVHVLQMNTPALSVLGKAGDGQMIGEVFFHAQLIGLLEYVGIQWTIGQVTECAKTAYSEYYWLTLAELKQFFTRVKAGHYTSNKNMMPPVFMEFLREYTSEMEVERYNYFSVEAQKTRWTPPENPVSDEVFAAGMEKIKGLFAPDPELTISEQLGGEDKFRELKQQAAEKAKELGIDDETIGNLKKENL